MPTCKLKFGNNEGRTIKFIFFFLQQIQRQGANCDLYNLDFYCKHSFVNAQRNTTVKTRMLEEEGKEDTMKKKDDRF